MFRNLTQENRKRVVTEIEQIADSEIRGRNLKRFFKDPAGQVNANADILKNPGLQRALFPEPQINEAQQANPAPVPGQSL